MAINVRCPANHGGQYSGGTADDDVLWRASFQPYRIDDDIQEYREGEQRCRFDIERESK
jgi:hypothetical protein